MTEVNVTPDTPEANSDTLVIRVDAMIGEQAGGLGIDSSAVSLSAVGEQRRPSRVAERIHLITQLIQNL